MRHKFLVLTVKKLLKSVYIYGSYRKIKTGLSLFLDHPVYLNVHVWLRFWTQNHSDSVPASHTFALCFLYGFNNRSTTWVGYPVSSIV